MCLACIMVGTLSLRALNVYYKRTREQEEHVLQQSENKKNLNYNRTREQEEWARAPQPQCGTTNRCFKESYVYPCSINSMVIHIVQVDRENGTVPIQKTAVTLNFHPGRKRSSVMLHLNICSLAFISQSFHRKNVCHLCLSLRKELFTGTYLSLNSLIKSSFLRTNCKGSSSSSLKVFCDRNSTWQGHCTFTSSHRGGFVRS